MRSSHPPIRTIFLQGLCTLLVLTSSMSTSARQDEPDSHSYTDFARVLKVDPIVTSKPVSISRKVCELVPDRRDHARRRQYDNSGRTILGGLLGGLLGHQFGGGRGKNALTVAGALIGAGIASDNNSRHHEYSDHHSVNRRQCRILREQRDQKIVSAYLVTYGYKDHIFVRRMERHPGERQSIRIRVTPLSSISEENHSV